MQQLKLASKYQNSIRDFIEGLKNTYADGLVSVILYGSAASGEFTDKHSNINLLIVLKDAGLANLKRIASALKKGKFNLLNTLFLTRDYIQNSTDVFPIEFLDMKENYVLLFGEDILKGLTVDIKNLRFQCEQELKSKLINIKKLYLRSQSKIALRVLLFKSANSALHILRNLVRLKGKAPAYLKEGILEDISGEFAINTAAFSRILEAKKLNRRLSYQESEGLLFAFVAELEKIINIVDRL